MEEMKPSKKEEENDFTRLPEDLFLSILRRITDDLKFLFQLSLVSKHFAATVNCVQTVSFTLPYMNTRSFESLVYKHQETFLTKTLNLTREEIVTLMRSSPVQELKFCLFLQNFKELKSIHLEFICNHTNHADFAIHQWKAKCIASGALSEKLVAVLATSAHACDAELREEREIPIECPFSHIRSGMSLLDCSRNWLLVLCLLLKCRSSLECVTITDSKKVGKLVIRDEELVAWRKNLCCGGSISDINRRTATVGWVRELRLPISRYVMKGVYFVVMGLFASNVDYDNEFNNWECYDVMEWEYEREEKLLGEAVREILTNHRAILKDY